MMLLADVRIYHRKVQYKEDRLERVIVLPKSWAHSTGNPFVANETGSSILIFVDNHYSTVKYHRQHLNLEAFSPEVEKRLCNFFESKGFSVCNAFSIQN